MWWQRSEGRDGRTGNRLSAQIEIPPPQYGGVRPLFLRAAAVAFFGVFLLAMALGIEDVVSAGQPARDAAQKVGSLGEELGSAPFWLRLLAELGFAFLIAAVVAFAIEMSSKREQADLVREAIKSIGDEVIGGVYKIRHDPDYVKTVVNSCLAVRHIRRNYTVTCTVSEFTDEECRDLGIKPDSLVKVAAEVKYESVNIGNDGGIFEGRYFIPRRAGKLDHFAQLHWLRVGLVTYDTSEAITALEITEGEPGYISSDRGYSFDIPTTPQIPVTVHLNSVFAKEKSDNEIFAYLLPTIGSTIRFIFQVQGLRIGAKARTATDMPEPQRITPGSYVEWEIKGPILPNNYVTVWWRSAADDGEPETGPHAVGSGASASLHGRPQAPSTAESVPPADGDETTAGAVGLQDRGFWARARKWLPARLRRGE
jgi:hypothetical protein